MRMSASAEFLRFAEHSLDAAHTSVSTGGSVPAPLLYQAAVSAFLLAAECHLNPYFLYRDFTSAAFPSSPSQLHKSSLPSTSAPKASALSANEFEAMQQWLHQWQTLNGFRCDIASSDTCPLLGALPQLELERDHAALQILLQAAVADSMQMQLQDSSLHSEKIVAVPGGDGITLVRKNQKLLASFIVRQLSADVPCTEAVLHGFVFLLRAATSLPAEPLTIILMVKKSLLHFHEALRRHRLLETSKSGRSAIVEHHIRRHLHLMNTLVEACVGVSPLSTGLPVIAWLEAITAGHDLPGVVRVFLWRGAAASFAKLPSRAPVLSVLSSVLRIFADPLICTNDADSAEISQLHPGLHEDFHALAERVVETIAAQLAAMHDNELPDVWLWLSDLCSRFAPDDGLPVSPHMCVSFNRLILRFVGVLLSTHMRAVQREGLRLFELLLALCCSRVTDIPLLVRCTELFAPIIGLGDADGLDLGGAAFERFKSVLCREPFPDLALLLLVKVLPRYSSEHQEQLILLTIPALAPVNWTSSNCLRRMQVLRSLFCDADASLSNQIRPLVPVVWSALNGHAFVVAPLEATRLIDSSVRFLMRNATVEIARELLEHCSMLHTSQCWASLATALPAILRGFDGGLTERLRLLSVTVLVELSINAPRLEWRLQSVPALVPLMTKIADDCATEMLAELLRRFLQHDEPEIRLAVLDELIAMDTCPVKEAASRSDNLPHFLVGNAALTRPSDALRRRTLQTPLVLSFGLVLSVPSCCLPTGSAGHHWPN